MKSRIACCFSVSMAVLYTNTCTAVKCSVSASNRERGGGLIVVLLFLLLFSVLGAALLSVTTLDIGIANSYHTAAELVYLADAGIAEGIRSIEASPLSLSELLATAADADGALSTSRDSDVLLLNSGDRPLLDGQVRLDVDGKAAGRYSVFIRNDASDGMGNPTDTNSALILLSVGFNGAARAVVEAVFARPALPRPRNAFTIGAVDPDLDIRLRTTAGAERLAGLLAANATDTFNPGWNGLTLLGSIGGPGDYRVVVVNGDCEFGPGTGYGLLLVRGELTFSGNFRWNGLILAVGQGTVRWPAATYGQISGAVVIERTRDLPDPANPLGPVLEQPGAAVAELAGAGFVELNQAEVDRVHRLLRYEPAGYREY